MPAAHAAPTAHDTPTHMGGDGASRRGHADEQDRLLWLPTTPTTSRTAHPQIYLTDESRALGQH